MVACMYAGLKKKEGGVVTVFQFAGAVYVCMCMSPLERLTSV